MEDHFGRKNKEKAGGINNSQRIYNSQEESEIDKNKSGTSLHSSHGQSSDVLIDLLERECRQREELMMERMEVAVEERMALEMEKMRTAVLVVRKSGRDSGGRCCCSDHNNIREVESLIGKIKLSLT